MAKITRFAALLCAVSIFQGAYAVTPGSPSLSFTFEIDGDTGLVKGTVTAPEKDNQWQALPAGTEMDIRVVRSCFALQESNVAVITFENMTPGEARTFTDTATPAWQYGQSYTYNAYASVDGGEESYQGYGSIKPGIDFSFAYNAVTAAAKEADGVYSVDITALVPDKTNAYPPEDIPVEMTALEFYRLDTDGNLDTAELIGTIPNPVKGETYTYTDNAPVVNSKNYYLVKSVAQFGMAEVRCETFVGYDVPRGPYPVSGEFQEDGGYRIFWTAPTEGVNWGPIDPAKTVYNVYRAWGRGEDERVQIATGITETEYVDYGTDMEQPRAVMYLVEAANDRGTGESTSSSYDYDVVIGPASKLPYVETFDDGMQKVWMFENSSNYGKFYIGTYAEFGDSTVDPYSGTGLIYVDYSYSYVPDGSTADMTSYKIDIAEAVCPVLSFYLYMIPSGGVTVVPQVAYDGGEFADLATIDVGDCTKAGWKKFTYTLQPAEGAENVVLRFHTEKQAGGKAAVFDEVTLTDNTEFTIENHLFSIVADTPVTVHEVVIKEYLGSEPLYKTPEIVKYNDVSYNVVGIAEGAFRENEAILSVNMSDRIVDVADEAFYGCTSLQAVSFGMGLASIGARAFADCPALESVIFKNPVVPAVADDAFSGIAEDCGGKCPEESLEAYEGVEGLKPINFRQSGIRGIDGLEAGEVKYYDLNGLRVENPAAGTVVIKRGRGGVRLVIAE